ncbi:uncharacterized protein A4U43_C01F20680 [Asparagus officinalis]|uniref:Uncharacterized protein n=1 Tax=Asparagus officinalis TaxID=4686 RepID=A0A5P1FSP4_ASPOF|nr:uncharacterized protein A4U43_C01F20680 [Asparagus officinalis]
MEKPAPVGSGPGPTSAGVSEAREVNGRIVAYSEEALSQISAIGHASGVGFFILARFPIHKHVPIFSPIALRC